MWVTECSKAHGRGKLVMMEGMFAIGGVVIAVWLDFGFYFLKGNSANWRFPIAFQAVFAVIVLSLVLSLPGKCSRRQIVLYSTQHRITKMARPKGELRRCHSFAGTLECTSRRLRTTTRGSSGDKRVYLTRTCGQLRKSVCYDQEPTSPSNSISDLHQYVGTDDWC